MGFGFKDAISRFAAKKQKQMGSKIVAPSGTNTASSLSSSPVIGRSDKKITKYGARKVKHKDAKSTKSVKFDFSCNRNIKVSPSTDIVTKPGAVEARGTKRHSSNLNSTSSVLGEEFTTSTTNQSNQSVVNENLVNNQARLPSPKGLHSRNLSYGTIYNAPKGPASTENPPRMKDGRVCLNLKMDKGNAATGESKPNGPARHVFGLGGCNYGHGSIINGMKSPKSMTSNSALICRKNDAEKVVSSLSHFELGMVDELNNAGNGEYKRGRFMNAISFYDKAIALCPLNAACHNNKAAALAALGKLVEAVHECLEAISSDPTYSRAHYRLGTLYTRLGQVDDAKKHFLLAGHGDGSDSIQHLLLIERHLEKMKRALKVEDWEGVLEESAKTLEAGAHASDLAIAAKAEALLNLHRSNEALEILMTAKKTVDARSARSCSRLFLVETQIYFYLGRFKEAVHAAEQATNLEPSSESLMWLKKAWGAADAHRAGNEYCKVGKYSEAFAMYSQGLQYLPTNKVLLCSRAACRSNLGQWERAIEDCNAALKGHPEFLDALLQRAHGHARLGQWEDAHKDYSELTKLMPGDPTLLNSLLQIQMELQRAWMTSRGKEYAL
ncbi:hypothetical protein Ancab_032145 [Ancistrocladus abbreviatus]